jgi:dynactin-5
MFCPDELASQADYISTAEGNSVHREAVLSKPKAVDMAGKCIVEKGVIVRGDLAAVKVDKFVRIGRDSVVRPPYALFADAIKFIPMSIGRFTQIGKNCIIEAAVIGVGCVVEEDCVLSKRCILKDYVLITKGTVVPADMVIPPFAIVSGRPAKITGERMDSVTTTTEPDVKLKYRSFKLI